MGSVGSLMLSAMFIKKSLKPFAISAGSSVSELPTFKELIVLAELDLRLPAPNSLNRLQADIMLDFWQVPKDHNLRVFRTYCDILGN